MAVSKVAFLPASLVGRNESSGDSSRHCVIVDVMHRVSLTLGLHSTGYLETQKAW